MTGTGTGEAGAIAATTALVNAATGAVGVDHIDMPVSPQKVWAAIENAANRPEA